MSAAPSAVASFDIRAFARRVRAGDQIAYLLTLICAASIFLVTCLLVYELWINSGLARHKFGWSFLITQTWDPVKEDFGALPFMLRNGGHVYSRTADLGAGWDRRGDLPF